MVPAAEWNPETQDFPRSFAAAGQRLVTRHWASGLAGSTREAGFRRVEAGLQGRAGRGHIWNLGDALRGSRHGVRLPQVHRLSGTVPGTEPAPLHSRSRCTVVGQSSVSGRAGSEEAPFIPAAASLSSRDASAAEANPVEGRACGSDQFSG